MNPDDAVTRFDRHMLLGQRGRVVWLTGLPGAGKSTIAAELELLLINKGRLACRLDGDVLRRGLCRDLGFSPADRDENVRRAGEVAWTLVDTGVIVLVSMVSPYRDARDKVRAKFEKGEFVEVHVATPLSVVVEQDPHGLYAKAKAGLTGVTGWDAPYEAPLHAEITISRQHATAADGAAFILEYITRNPVRAK